MIGAITVYNQSGQKMREFNLMTGNNRLDIGDFSNGLYFFRIVTNNKTMIKKVVKN